jgi:hypothetical protein
MACAGALLGFGVGAAIFCPLYTCSGGNKKDTRIDISTISFTNSIDDNDVLYTTAQVCEQFKANNNSLLTS